MGASQRPRDRIVAELAEGQHGVVARRQLIEQGLSARQIDRSLAEGRLHLRHRGVYAVGPGLGRNAAWMAAVLAAGEGALLGYRSAATLWGFATNNRTRVDVVTGRRRHDGPGVSFHHTRFLDPEDRTVREGIPATSVARPLLDLDEVLDRRRLERVFEEAERLRILDTRALGRVLQRSHGRHGVPALRALATVGHEPPPTRSGFERDFLDLCAVAEIPAPAVNSSVEGFEVDAVWHDERIAVELDSFAFHSSRAAFERDRGRDIALQLADYRVLRITHRRLANHPAAVMDVLRALLEAPR